MQIDAPMLISFCIACFFLPLHASEFIPGGTLLHSCCLPPLLPAFAAALLFLFITSTRSSRLLLWSPLVFAMACLIECCLNFAWLRLHLQWLLACLHEDPLLVSWDSVNFFLVFYLEEVSCRSSYSSVIVIVGRICSGSCHLESVVHAYFVWLSLNARGLVLPSGCLFFGPLIMFVNGWNVAHLCNFLENFMYA